jgi:hypothetical protein
VLSCASRGPLTQIDYAFTQSLGGGDPADSAEVRRAMTIVLSGFESLPPSHANLSTATSYCSQSSSPTKRFLATLSGAGIEQQKHLTFSRLRATWELSDIWPETPLRQNDNPRRKHVTCGVVLGLAPSHAAMAQRCAGAAAALI